MPSDPHGLDVDELESLEEIADEKEGKLSFVPELVKRVAVAGLGALFMTEEGIRSLAGQLKLPKEVLGFIVSQAEKTKDDIGRVVSDEVRRFLQSEKLREEFLKLLTGTTIEITAQVRLMPEKPHGDAKPGLSVADIAVRRRKRAKKE
ncbi:MAG TPA: hypothetical protein VEM39_12660 [Myxococcaceae bacterium]|jgi:hypothetical protein|nr:hypothetical protein [Myxococcaceae bacterium]